MLNKKKRAKFIDFQKKILTPFCKKGLGQPAKSSLMSGFKDGGGVIVPGYLEFTAPDSAPDKHFCIIEIETVVNWKPCQ